MGHESGGLKVSFNLSTAARTLWKESVEKFLLENFNFFPLLENYKFTALRIHNLKSFIYIYPLVFSEILLNN